MSSLSGGAADKLGNRYEALWGIRALLEVLSGEADSIRIEPPGDDKAEFYVVRNGNHEYWQAKRQIISQQTWTLAVLKSEGILDFYLEQVKAGRICHFVSTSDAPELRTLADQARHLTDFEEFKRHFLESGEKHQKAFNDLCSGWKNIEARDVHQLLQRVWVRVHDEISCREDLHQGLRLRFAPKDITVFAVFQTLYLDSIRKTLTAKNIQDHLQAAQIESRTVPVSAGLIRKIHSLTDSYIAGQRTKLICGQVTSRKEAQDVIEKILNADTGQDFLITGSAGTGKSTGLLEIVEGLKEAGRPVLAFRLDHCEPVKSPIIFGKNLDLADESPALILSQCFPNQSVVLVIDQLDFVSSSSGRHPDFLDTVAALIDEVHGLQSKKQKIHLILACRLFDYKNDHRLQRLSHQSTHIEIKLFSEDQARSIISQVGGDAQQLSPKQLQSLCLPQNLALFIESGLVCQPYPGFVSQKGLFDEYWNKKYEALCTQLPGEAAQWQPVLETLVERMNNNQRLSVPKAFLGTFTPRFLGAMVSAGVLTFDQKVYGFGHESFFDYCFAWFFSTGNQLLADFLEADPQHLFRRAQVRQVLTYLRDDDPTTYLKNVKSLLSSEKIRSHLKILVIELLADFPNPTEDEWEIIWPYIQSEINCARDKTLNSNKIASRAWQQFNQSKTLFQIVDRTKLLDNWLNSGESFLENYALRYLTWQADEHGDRVAELLEAHVDKLEDWPSRFPHLLRPSVLGKSRRFFELVLSLVRRIGLKDEAVDQLNEVIEDILQRLGQAQGSWYVEVVACWLECLTLQIQRFPSVAEQWRRKWVEGQVGTRGFFGCALGEPEEFLNILLPAILRATEATKVVKQKQFPRDQVWHYLSWNGLNGTDFSLENDCLSGCVTAFNSLCSKDPEQLQPFINRLQSCQTYIGNYLLLKAYQQAPKFFADEALSLLVREPDRLRCGYTTSQLWESRCLIEKCSPHCSKETLAALEKVLLNFSTPYEQSEEGAKHKGYASYALLSATDPTRQSPKTVERFAKLVQKFGSQDFKPQGFRFGSVVSPIPEETAAEMTDEEWLAAIAKYHSQYRETDPEHPEKGGASSLALVLQENVKRKPERFARLALLFPPDTASVYLRDVLYELKDATISEDLKLDVVRKVIDSEEEDCLKAAIDVLGKIKQVFLPEDCLKFLSSLATEHSDPQCEEQVIVEKDQPSQRSGLNILTHGMNTVRGRAAEAIRDLVWENPTCLDTFSPTIEKLVNDPIISVRACVASTLYAVAKHNFSLALSLFKRLIECDDRLLGTGYVYDFIYQRQFKCQDEFRPIIERMLKSEVEEVQEVGGQLASLARLHDPGSEDLAAMALKGSKAMRLGAATIAAHNIGRQDCREWCEPALIALFHDPEEEIRKQAGSCFSHFSSSAPMRGYNDFIQKYLKSPAFVDETSDLLYLLERTEQQLPEIVTDVCSVFVEKCAEAARDMRTRQAGNQYTVSKLVFRAYAQLDQSPEHTRVLDLIDRMCEEGFDSTTQELAEFER